MFYMDHRYVTCPNSVHVGTGTVHYGRMERTAEMDDTNLYPVLARITRTLVILQCDYNECPKQRSKHKLAEDLDFALDYNKIDQKVPYRSN